MVLAPYATLSKNSLGRLYEEDDNLERVFELDRSKVIRSTAFRRLEYKTQVLVNHVGDHYRTRLTHSLEVAQTARTVARMLALNEDLAEVIALAHDLGHPPFGHAGEEGLNKAAQKYGGFDHNLHAIKIVTKLEESYPNFKGLNLTAETLEGLIKHNGPIDTGADQMPMNILDNWGIPLDRWPSLEAQVAAISDDIAYCNHDLDDAIRGRFIDIKEVYDLPIISEVFFDVKKRYPGIIQEQLVRCAVNNLARLMIEDLLVNSRQLIKEYKVKSLEDVWSTKKMLIKFSDKWEVAKNALKAFLFERYYRHYLINRTSIKAERVIEDIFNTFVNNPQCLPGKWHIKYQEAKENKAQVIIDYIAGMTDRYAISEYNNLLDPKLF